MDKLSPLKNGSAACEPFSEVMQISQMMLLTSKKQGGFLHPSHPKVYQKRCPISSLRLPIL
jgi:hypothetical protein